MGSEGEWNVGQLLREHYGDAVRSIGFTTYRGTVTAASNWDEPPVCKLVRPALPDSYETLFHETGIPRFSLSWRDDPSLRRPLEEPHLERAIGVIYRPETERLSHYFEARLAGQFDAVIHFDETTAVEPLDREASWETVDAPETFPSGV
jgi:erythromycin esterase-like protein